MGTKSCLHGGPLFDGERLFDSGTVIFEDELVVDIVQGDLHDGIRDAWNTGGKLIAPGLVDLHSDALEKCIEMRPGVYFDPEFALQSLDLRLAGLGITTYCHAISFADDVFSIRSSENAEKLVRLIKDFSASGRGFVRHLVHVRYEITSLEGYARIEKLVDEDLVDAVSIMDHTPGQGQFKTLESYITYKTGTFGITPEQVAIVAEQKAAQKPCGLSMLSDFARMVRQAGIPFLSHDDDTVEKIDFVRELGVTGCEFPVALEAVETAKASGMKVFMGAPNLFRDCSTNGHLKASDTIRQGLCDGLMSDYYPECLPQMPFIVNERYGLGLAESFMLVTSGAGDFLESPLKPGRLAPGTCADIVVINNSGPWAKVAQVWVCGKPVLFQSGSGHGISKTGNPTKTGALSKRAA